MALPKKVEKPVDYSKDIAKVESKVEKLKEELIRVNQRLEEYFKAIEEKREVKRIASINKLEIQETHVEQREESKMKMDYQDQLASMRNAVAILPPNLMEDGRHTLENISAICGFKATEEMLDEVYGEAV